MRSFCLTSFLLLLALPGFAEGTKELLLPISGNSLPGGHGTFWTATLMILNDGAEVAEVTVDRTCAPFGIVCPDGFALVPGEWTSTGLEGGGMGNLLTVVTGDPEFSYRLYVSDSPVSERKVLTELPIVPVNTLSNERVTLFKIDLPVGTRHALRVYDVSAAENPAVRVTARNIHNDAMLFDGELQLRGRDELHPAEATLFDFLPNPDINIVVTVRPLDPEMRIWAFLSVTDNLTRDLVLYTPQTPAIACN